MDSRRRTYARRLPPRDRARRKIGDDPGDDRPNAEEAFAEYLLLRIGKKAKAPSGRRQRLTHWHRPDDGDNILLLRNSPEKYEHIHSTSANRRRFAQTQTES